MWSRDVELRLYEIDGLGHLTATAYLGLFEENRAAWIMSTLSVEYPSYVLAAQQLNYRREIRFAHSPVTVTLSVVRLGRSSLDLTETIGTSFGVCAESLATIVTWDMTARRSRPITPEERDALGSYCAPAQ